MAFTLPDPLFHSNDMGHGKSYFMHQLLMNKKKYQKKITLEDDSFSTLVRTKRTHPCSIFKPTKIYYLTWRKEKTYLLTWKKK